MAPPSRPSDLAVVPPEVQDRLRREPYCFEFFQAVRLLERLYPDRAPVGHFASPADEISRFGVQPSLAFPPSEIHSLETGKGEQPRMVVNFLGLTGPQGMLPLYYTELVANRAAARDTALRDFLDLFHHRFLSLFYRAWEKHRFPVIYRRGERDIFTRQLLNLVGLGTGHLQDRQAIKDESVIYYAGLLAQQPRSALALQLLLSDYFDVPVEIEQFVGDWYQLAPSEQCRLDESGAHSEELGFGAVVGDEVWEPQARARIVLGPLPLRRYLDFLPTGSSYAPLREWTRYFAGNEMDFEVQLILAREDVPPCELGSEGDESPRLGWVSWVKSRPIDRDPAETILRL